jgi:hypothetical protein
MSLNEDIKLTYKNKLVPKIELIMCYILRTSKEIVKLQITAIKVNETRYTTTEVTEVGL